jgi:DNA topoisomerase IB
MREGATEAPIESAVDSSVDAAARQVAAQLRNTPAVCRKSYINPAVFDGWRSGVLHRMVPAQVSPGSRKGEKVALEFLREIARPSAYTSRVHTNGILTVTKRSAVVERAAVQFAAP